MLETRHNNADLVCFKTQTLLATWRTPNQPRVESRVSLEAEHLSQSVGCKQQSSVSHISTESEITSLDAGNVDRYTSHVTFSPAHCAH